MVNKDLELELIASVSLFQTYIQCSLLCVHHSMLFRRDVHWAVGRNNENNLEKGQFFYIR